MMYHRIECPTCGDEIVAESTKEPQRCKWCRRLFSVNLTKRKRKYIWEAEQIDFPESVEQQGKQATPAHNCSGSKKV